jgi:hypothetical protein
MNINYAPKIITIASIEFCTFLEWVSQNFQISFEDAYKSFAQHEKLPNVAYQIYKQENVLSLLDVFGIDDFRNNTKADLNSILPKFLIANYMREFNITELFIDCIFETQLNQ